MSTIKPEHERAASRIVTEWVASLEEGLAKPPGSISRLIEAVAQLLADTEQAAKADERLRALRLIDEHEEVETCLGNCWAVIRRNIAGKGEDDAAAQL